MIPLQDPSPNYLWKNRLLVRTAVNCQRIQFLAKLENLHKRSHDCTRHERGAPMLHGGIVEMIADSKFLNQVDFRT